jgi:hypothetical protein
VGITGSNFAGFIVAAGRSDNWKKTSCGNLGEKFAAKKDELRRKL